MKKIVLTLLMILGLFFSLSTTTYAASSINNQSDLSHILDDWYGPEINISYDGIENKFISDFDITEHMINNDGVSYFVSKDGSDSNDGLTLSTAFLTIEHALSQTDLDTVYIDSGIYEAVDNRIYADMAFNIIGLSDDVYITGSRSYAGWSLVTDQTYTYQKALETGDTAFNVRDISNGWSSYEKLESISEVEATEGSFYFDDATDIVYVHALGGLEPTEDVQIVQFNAFNISRSDVYFESVTILAGSATVIAKKNTDLFMNNVKLLYSDGPTANGLSVQSSNSYLVDVESSYNFRDGLNYHNDDPTYLDNQYIAIEIDTISHHNGLLDTNDNNQGSSAHEDFQIVRINGVYYNNNGENISDIGTTISYGFGIETYSSEINIDFEKSDLNKSYLFNPIANSAIGINDNVNPFIVYYSLTYQTQLASTIFSEFYQEGDTILLPEDPLRTGYSFDGWYEDSSFTTAFSFVEMPSERIISYARWIPTPSNGGSITAPDQTLTFLGLAWYWWVIGGVVVVYFGFTKKGRKSLGLKPLK